MLGLQEITLNKKFSLLKKNSKRTLKVLVYDHRLLQAYTCLEAKERDGGVS